MLCSEGQVVGFYRCVVGRLKFLDRRYGCRILGSRLDGHNTPSAQLVEPAAVVFVGVNVERNGQFLADLNVELLDALLTKYFKSAFAGILIVRLNNIFLYFPRVSRMAFPRSLSLLASLLNPRI